MATPAAPTPDDRTRPAPRSPSAATRVGSAPPASALGRPGPPLAGLRVLLVEHDYWLAQEAAGLLREAGAEVAGPVGRLDEARELVARGPKPDGPVTSVRLGDERADPLVAELLARGVPVLLATAYPERLLPAWLRALPRLAKPVGHELGRAAAEAFGRGRAANGP